MNKLRIMSVFGTRPEAIKMAPLVRELALREEIESLCCVTAQHRQMLDSVLDVFALKPDWDLDIMTPRQTLSTITSKCLTGMDEAIETLKPDMILVHGDTSTTFAGALSAFYHQIWKPYLRYQFLLPSLGSFGQQLPSYQYFPLILCQNILRHW